MTSAQDFLIAKFALRASLIATEALQECLEEQRRRAASGQPTPLVQLLVQRRLIARDQLSVLMRTVELTTFDCERCHTHFPYSAFAPNAALACPRCRGPVKILKDDGEPVSERLMTGRRPATVALATVPLLDTRKDPSTTAAKTTSGALLRPTTGREEAHVPRTFGPYEILSELGRGGMGVVYKARHPTLDRIVALKVLIAGNMASKTQIKRFQREAELAGKLKHPGIVPIHDIGQVDDRHYFTMEFVEGQPLETLVKNRELSVRQAVEITRDIARALAHAHTNGVVHRDVKPANVIIDTEGHPHVMDFGLAKDLDSESPRLTREGAAVGTPFYMAPEQAKGDRAAVGPASDIYSLGVVFFELLTFDLPFKATTQAELTKRILNDAPPRPSTVEPAIEPDVELVVLKALEKDKAERYATADDMADDLDRWLAGEPVSARPRGALNLCRALWRRWRATLAPALVGLSIVGIVSLGVVLVVQRARAAEAVRLDKERERIAREKKKADDDLKKHLEQEAAERAHKAAEELSLAEEAFADADKLPIVETTLFLEKLNQAISYAGESIAASASSARAFLVRARAREQGRQFDVALDDYHRARELDAGGPTGGEAGFREARLIVRRQQDEAAALKLLTEVAARADAGVWRPIARACAALLDHPARLDEARGALDEARLLDRNCAEMFYLKALAVSEESDRPGAAKAQEAVAAVTACLEADHKNARAFAFRSKLYLVLGKRDLAEQDVQAALLLDPDENLALLVRANLAASIGHPQDAIPDLRRIVKMQEPHEDPELLLELAQLLAGTGAQSEARVYAARAIARAPQSELGYLLHARLLANLDLFDQALDQLRTGLKTVKTRSGTDAIRDATISILFHAQRLDEAETFCREQTQRTPDDAGVFVELAEVVAQRGPEAVARAAALYDQCHAKFPNYIPGWESHAHFLLVQHKTKETLELAQKLVATTPGSSNAWVAASTIDELLGRHEDAKAAAEKAVQLDGKSSRARSRRGSVAIQDHDFKAAELDATAALELDPQDATALTILAGIGIEANRPVAETATLLSRALDSDPAEADAAYMLAVLLVREGKFDSTIRMLERTLALIADPPAKLLTMLGIAQLQRGKVTDAERSLKAALKRDDSIVNAHAAYADLLLQRDDRPASKLHAQRALEIDPACAVARRILDAINAADAPSPPPRSP